MKPDPQDPRTDTEPEEDLDLMQNTFEARYFGSCENCTEKIAPKQEVIWAGEHLLGHSLYAHAVCPDSRPGGASGLLHRLLPGPASERRLWCLLMRRLINAVRRRGEVAELNRTSPPADVDDPLGIGRNVLGWHIKPTEGSPIYPYLATYDGPDGRP